MRHGNDLRAEAVALFGRGLGYRAVAKRLGMSVRTARKWQYTYRVAGKEGLLVTKHKRYDYETKLAAARDVVERGAGKPVTMEKLQDILG